MTDKNEIQPPVKKIRVYLCLVLLVFQNRIYAEQIHVQKLNEIQLAAEKFVVLENLKNRTAWIADNVNNKVFVPECKKPLLTKWVPKNYGLSHKSVAINCQQTDDATFKTWDVFVPVSRKN